ncbi:MAG: hypothetical protein CM15mP93_07250 [Thiotrichaceae bacterium]|nr:MAG: hypothetical protein CM15mP93_07250 [Thiotrichaceae bacterium]
MAYPIATISVPREINLSGRILFVNEIMIDVKIIMNAPREARANV